MRMWCCGVAAALVWMAQPAAADERCMWENVFYGAGAVVCRNGMQARCVGGAWQPTGEQCADDAGDPGGEEAEPGVVEPRVVEPTVPAPDVP